MKITRISRYAWFKIEVDDLIIHIDPGYAGYYESQGFNEKNFEDKADLILITHHHKDHIQQKAVEKILTNKTKIYATRLCAEKLTLPYEVVEPGYEDVHKDVKIQAVYAYNTKEGHSTRKPHHKGECVGYVISLGNSSIYHAGDTDLIPEMASLGNIDVAFLPIGGTFTMDIDEATTATKLINPKVVVPMHTLKVDPGYFIEQISKTPSIKCVYLEPGQFYQST